MSLLREIQDAAIDADTQLATLLRKCKVLAARLGNEEFKKWTNDEVSGYKSADDLPPYRKFFVHSKGHFAGGFGSMIRNANIPLSSIPTEFRDIVSHAYMIAPVAALESLVTSSGGGAEQGSAQEPWNPDLIALVGQDIYPNHNCVAAWKVIPIPSIIATLDEIRNRILDFVLQIEAEDPNAGEAAINSNPVPPEKIHQFFHMYIAGDVQNVATGSQDFQQTAHRGEEQNAVLLQLLAVLERLEDNPANQEAKASIRAMQNASDTEAFKLQYQKFMSILADHMQVLGPIVAPYLPALSALIR